MSLRFSPAAFVVIYCAVYVAGIAADLPAFRYYPLAGHLNWGPAMVKGMGPAMAWYGIMAEAALAGGLAALVVPDAWLRRALRNLLWVAPAAAMLACVFLMRKFFA